MSQLPESLPTLRQTLEILSAAPAADGSPRWSVYDPIAHRYISVSAIGFAFLSNWKAGAETAKWLESLAPLKVDADALVEFLEQGQSYDWFDSVGPESTQSFIEREQKGQKSLASRVMHGYLFFKIPILKPEPWIGRLADRLLFLRSPVLTALVMTISLLAIVGLIRNWDAFFATFSGFLNWQGAGAYFAAIVAIKIAHEMGHAIQAKWRGARVGSMGVAFLVLFPILYTDTTDSWRLKSRWDRLAIVLAGLKVELAIGALALFLWGILPPGQAKSLCFVVATTAIVSTLLVNLSPFMRFDGYFAMADLTGIDNLQPRAFALTRWWIRKTILGFTDPCPEPFSRATRAGLVVYSVSTWIYRFFLFLGIAVLVYSIAFKLLGILLFIIEVWYFIMRPVVAEFRVWAERRGEYRLTRSSAVSGAVITLILISMVYPLRSTLTLPAVVTASDLVEVFPSVTGQLVTALASPQSVKAGDLLAEVRPRELQQEIEIEERRLALLTLELETAVASGRFTELLSFKVEIDSQESLLADLKARLADTKIFAPFDGTWLPGSGLTIGREWSGEESLGRLVGGGAGRVVAYIDSADISSVEAGSEATFVSDSGEVWALSGDTEVSELASEFLSVAALASTLGGPLPVRESQAGLRLEQPFHRLTSNVETSSSRYLQKGVLQMSGQPRSIVERAWLSFGSLLRQESGF